VEAGDLCAVNWDTTGPIAVAVAAAAAQLLLLLVYMPPEELSHNRR
jgi:hypothetical protein